MCSEVLESDPENVNVLKDRAEAFIQDEQYEEGKTVRCSRVLFLQFSGVGLAHSAGNPSISAVNVLGQEFFVKGLTCDTAVVQIVVTLLNNHN